MTGTTELQRWVSAEHPTGRLRNDPLQYEWLVITKLRFRNSDLDTTHVRTEWRDVPTA